MSFTPAAFVTDGHALYVGPNFRGSLTTSSGTTYTIQGANQDVIEVHPDHAEELSFLIGEHYVEHGHPAMREEVVDEHGNKTLVQRPFVHHHHKKFDKHPRKFKGTPAGVAREDG